MHRLSLILMAIICLSMTGCAGRTVENQLWKPISELDRFTDIETKMVTVGDLSAKGSVWTRSLRYYPFVSLRNGEIAVGIRSGGTYKMPTGTVQLRVDSNKTWTVSPEETPIYLAPENPSMAMPLPDPANASPQAAEMLALTKSMTEAAQAHGQTYAAKMVSPFTAATGDKAKAIIREMLAGSKIIYRTVGYNQAASSEGEVVVDASFREALKQIGITESMLK